MKLFTLVLVLVLMGVVDGFGADVKYGITIAGVEVTSKNKDDVFSDGTAKFDPSKSTLTLNGLKKECKGRVLETKIPLEIRFEGAQTSLKSLDDDCIVAEKDVVMVNGYNGGAALTFEGKKHAAVFKGNARIYLPEMANFLGDQAPAIDMTGHKLTIWASRMSAWSLTNKEQLAIVNCGDFEMLNSSLQKNVVWDSAAKKFMDGESEAKMVTTAKDNTKYEVYVMEKRVTAVNCFDIFADGGSVVYDVPSNTITFKNVDIDFDCQYYESVFRSVVPDITIKFLGNNRIKSAGKGLNQQYYGSEPSVVKIVGKGTVELDCYENAIECYTHDLEISGGVTVKAHSRNSYGLRLYGKTLIVDNSNVEFSTASTNEYLVSAQCGGLMTKGVKITSDHTFAISELNYQKEMHFLDPDGARSKKTVAIGVGVPLPGIFDVNSDGKVNSTDIISVYNYIGNPEKAGVTSNDADVNVDYKVNSADVVRLYNYIIMGK